MAKGQSLLQSGGINVNAVINVNAADPDVSVRREAAAGSTEWINS